MRPLRIIFDASPMLVNRTGIAYYTEQLATSLAEQYPNEIELVGFYYNFLGRKSTKHFPRRKNLRYKGVNFLPGKIVYQLRRWGIEVPVEYLAKTSGDFILYPNFLSYPSFNRTPSAPVIHDLTYLDLPQYVAHKNRQDLERFVPKAIERSNFVITVSDFTKQRVRTIYNTPKENIVVTPIPPSEPRIFTEKKRAGLLKKQGVNKPYILFLGTVEPRKNLIGLMEAYTLLPEEIRREHSLVIAGMVGWNCEAELAKIKDLQERGYDIKQIGYVDEPTRAALYAGARLFVSASSYEGFGMPVLEAMSYGTPVAASNIPVFREVAGDSAIYFDQAEATTIARTLSKLLSDPKQLEKLGNQGKRRAHAMHWDEIAKQVYDRIVTAVKK